ncbi:MAG: hypothetical protein L3K16_02475 [Thermoplasmata archaeon]|nr:hypothetical protein [Thermoplasmata archaeon]
MRTWTTIHQRRYRARKGQVSAVAVILGLLLFVAFIANFILAELPPQMTQYETDHIILVEDQLARLQATILAESLNASVHLALVSPVSLGSQADPPFGQAATSSVQTEFSSVGTVASYQISDLNSLPMTWDTGSACLNGGHGTCSTAAVKNFYNEAVNGTAEAITVSGTGASLFYNLTGSNDTVTITWSGPNMNVLNLVVNGNNDTVTFKKSAADTGSPRGSFEFYGADDKFILTPSGSHSGAGGTVLTVQFVGSVNGICPWGNLSATDKLGTFGTGGTLVNVSTTWWNSVGYESKVHTHTYSSGVETYQNSTGFQQCAFTKSNPTTFTAQESGGLLVNIYNHYIAQALVAYDQGAVVAQEAGGGSIVIDPPAISVTQQTAGSIGDVTLVNLVMTPSTQAGLSTASVMSKILTVSHFSVDASANQSLSSPFTFTITTLFPDAWWTFFNNAPSGFPSGSTCVTIRPLAAPYTCLSPPEGTVEEIVAPMIVQSLVVTDVTAQVWII